MRRRTQIQYLIIALPSSLKTKHQEALQWMVQRSMNWIIAPLITNYIVKALAVCVREREGIRVKHLSSKKKKPMLKRDISVLCHRCHFMLKEPLYYNRKTFGNYSPWNSLKLSIHMLLESFTSCTRLPEIPPISTKSSYHLPYWFVSLFLYVKKNPSIFFSFKKMCLWVFL